MEPSYINLKQEHHEPPTTWHMYSPFGPSVSPQTQRRIPKRSVSFTSNASSERSYGQGFEPNSFPLDMKPGEWGPEHYEYYGQHVPVNQQGPADSFEQFHHGFPAEGPWKQQHDYQEAQEGPMNQGAKDSFERLPEIDSFSASQQANSHAPHLESHVKMESFPPEEVTDFKHVVYNLLVEYHNDPTNVHLVEPCTLVEHGRGRNGFRFNENCNPEKRLPELYVQHLKNAQLELENQNSPLIQDLYKFYMRSCVELLSKYFEKIDKYTYLYEDADNPLFVPNGNLLDAEVRIKNMKTRTRKKKATKKEIPANIKVVVPTPKPPVMIPAAPVPLRAAHGRKKTAFYNSDLLGLQSKQNLME